MMALARKRKQYTTEKRSQLIGWSGTNGSASQLTINAQNEHALKRFQIPVPKGMSDTLDALSEIVQACENQYELHVLPVAQRTPSMVEFDQVLHPGGCAAFSQNAGFSKFLTSD